MCVCVYVHTEQARTRSTSEGFAREAGKAEKREEGGGANEKVGHGWKDLFVIDDERTTRRKVRLAREATGGQDMH